MILAIRTDQPGAELYLLQDDGGKVAEKSWQADRELAKTLLATIEKLLNDSQLKFGDLTGIIVFTGSGSFTGLRIGATVANALAYAQSIPVVSGEGEDWLKSGLQMLKTVRPGHYVGPTYDREPNITKPTA